MLMFLCLIICNEKSTKTQYYYYTFYYNILEIQRLRSQSSEVKKDTKIVDERLLSQLEAVKVQNYKLKLDIQVDKER